MAIVTSFRFTESSGAICIDQESWHIWRRKNWFTDNLYPLVPEILADRFGVELVYGGVGHPPFHFEVAREAQLRLTAHLENPDLDPDTVTVTNLGEIVLEAFQSVHFRRVNDKLEFLYGFGIDDFNAGTYSINGNSYEIKRKSVKDRAVKIIEGKETTGYSPLPPPVEACLIGVDPHLGFSAFALKEADGVLGFQSCWFESLGIGRDGAAIRFAKLLNNRFLDTRRTGEHFGSGMVHLLDAIQESMDHFGQNGGFGRFIILDGKGAGRKERVRDICDDRARLAFEMVRTLRGGLISRDACIAMLEDLIIKNGDLLTMERQLFDAVDDPALLGKLLRGYKVDEPDLPTAGPEKQLYATATAPAVLKGESR